MNEKTPVDVKKPYQTPVLSEYGDVREITQQGSHTTHSDHGNNSMTA
jgi:hypothetical protein